MRRDMKDVIIDTGRTGKDWDSISRTRMNGKSIDELDNLPQQEGIKRRLTDSWNIQLADRIAPLVKFLRANVGRPWDKVFSEICEHADARSLRGKHLREHVEFEVDTWSERLAKNDKRWPRSSRFYVDAHGILREDTNRRYYQQKPNYDPDVCVLGDRHFERINACWFEVWYVKEKRPFQRWDFIKRTNIVEYSLVEVVSRKRQLGKKQLRDLGLSNDPNFKWWK